MESEEYYLLYVIPCSQLEIHGVTSQKKVLFIVAVVRTSDPSKVENFINVLEIRVEENIVVWKNQS
jgi:hypothetical protein